MFAIFSPYWVGCLPSCHPSLGLQTSAAKCPLPVSTLLPHPASSRKPALSISTVHLCRLARNRLPPLGLPDPWGPAPHHSFPISEHITTQKSTDGTLGLSHMCRLCSCLLVPFPKGQQPAAWDVTSFPGRRRQLQITRTSSGWRAPFRYLLHHLAQCQPQSWCGINPHVCKSLFKAFEYP